MSSVFLSYHREDVDRAGLIASALEISGHSVWWDRNISGGAQYSKEIDKALKLADAVVVLWSERSVESAWVRDEAAEGRDQGKLVPVLLDGVKPPMGFRQYQTVDLSNWRARKASPQLAELLHAIDTLVGSLQDSERAVAPATPRLLSRKIAVASGASAAALVAISAIALLFWEPWASQASAVIAVSAADSSRTSQDYARDLLAQLGQLQSARPDTLQLVGGTTKHAGLLFEVAGLTEGQHARANVVLIDPESGGLLWSKAFQRPIADIGDLRQELSYTAAQVLECSVEAYPRGRPALKPEVLKQYLNGCAEWAHGDFGEPSDLIPVFRRVVVAAPQFGAAWGKLISAETEAFNASGDSPGVETPRVRQIRRDIATARRIDPGLPEAYLAEADILPLSAFSQKLSLVERAVASRPDNAMAVAFRSSLLLAVGRVNDALNDARRAAELNPVSPRARENYVFALAQAGRTPAALEEIEKAERIWPGSSAISRARFAINLRFGDPRVAWDMIQSGKVGGQWSEAQSFVKARLSQRPPDIELAIRDAKAAYERSNMAWGNLVQALSIFDREDELLALLMRVPIVEAIWITDVTFRPAARELWRNPKSLAYAKRVGLLQYWRSSGKWPDFCGETDLPYNCKKEAAKVLG